MNLKLTYFSTAMIISALILVFGSIAGAALNDEEPFFLSILGIILFVNVASFLLSRRAENKKNK